MVFFDLAATLLRYRKTWAPDITLGFTSRAGTLTRVPGTPELGSRHSLSVRHSLLVPVPNVDDEKRGGDDDADDRGHGQSYVHADVDVRVFVNGERPVLGRPFAASPPLHLLAHAQVQRPRHPVVLSDLHFSVA